MSHNSAILTLRLLSYEVGSSALIDGKDGRTGSRPIIRTNGLNPVEALDAVLYAYSTNVIDFFPSLRHSVLYSTEAVATNA